MRLTRWRMLSSYRAQQHGVAAADIKKLKEGGVHTVEHLAHAPKKQLAEIKGLSEAKIEKMQAVGKFLSCAHNSLKVLLRDAHAECHAAFKIIPMGFTTAAIVAEQRKEVRQGAPAPNHP
jgi:DNA repair protein RAD51